MRLECDPSIAFELSEEFSFYVAGYTFMPAYKVGRWDGKIRLLDVRTRKLFSGLLFRLMAFCERENYSIEMNDKAAMRPQIALEESYIDNWQAYGAWKPYDYQLQGAKDALRLNKCLLLSPTASGKSYIMYMMIRHLLEYTDTSILITVPRTALVEQLQTDFVEYAAGSGWSVLDNVCGIYSGKEKNSSHRVKISTWHSIYKLPKTWFDGFGAYLCDEAHEADAKSLSGIIDKLGHAPVRIGLTGTIEDTKLHELELLGRFGPIVRTKSTAELMEEGYIATLDIVALRLEYSEEERKMVRYLDYQSEIDFLLAHPKRNKLLCNLALKHPKNCLMLFNYIDKHGVILYEMLKASAEKYGKNIYYIAGSVDVDIREKIRAVVEKEDNAIIIASMGTMSIGTNIKNLHCLIFCHPYKAKIKTLQSIGRTLRKNAGKSGATLYDIADDLVITSKKGVEKLNTTMKHFIERLRIYQNENFKYKIVSIKLNS